MQTCPYCNHIFSPPFVNQSCGQSIDQQVPLESPRRCDGVDCLSSQCTNPFHVPSPELNIPQCSNPFFKSYLPLSGSAIEHICPTPNCNPKSPSLLPTPHVSGHMFHFPNVPNQSSSIFQPNSATDCQISCQLNCLTHGGQLMCNAGMQSFQFSNLQLFGGSQLHKQVESKLTLRMPNIEAEHRMQICCQRLEESGWYWKQLTWQQAMSLLDSTDVGTFIIRDSSDPKYKFSLSVQTDRGPTSVRVHYMDGKFRLDCEAAVKSTLPVFLCVIKMVQYYVNINEHLSHHVWVDNNGQVYSPIAIKKPLKIEPQTLKHLCRLAVNEKCEKKFVRLKLPVPLLKYLEEYPYWC